MEFKMIPINRGRAAAFLVSYAGLAWLIIQVADVVVPRLALPAWIPTAAVAVSVLTLPFLLLVYIFALPRLSPTYIEKQIECIRTARESVSMSVHTLDPSGRDHRIALLQKALGEAISRGVSVSMMSPGGVDRAQAAYELGVIHGVPIRVLNELESQDFRFTLVDSSTVLLSHQPIGGKQFSKHFSVIESEILNATIQRYFDHLWNRGDAMTFEQYLRSLCLSLGGAETPASCQRLSDRLGVPIYTIRGVLGLTTNISESKGDDAAGRTSSRFAAR